MALGRLADDASGRDDVEVTTDLPAEIPDWDEGLEEGVYRIAQEALENIVRHAHASESVIKLTGDTTFLKLEIQDNGRGFYPPHVPDDGRYGIRGMKERAEALGGKITIESQPGKGTHIMFLWGAES
jgi:two-component system NarL family sensor kinase